MKLHHLIKALTLGFSLCVSTATVASADTYPSRPITLVVPFAAGGPTDVLARWLSKPLSKSLGQKVLVLNKAGAGGTVAMGYVAKSKADGYTLLLHHNGMATSSILYRKLPFELPGDFSYVGLVAQVPMTLIGRANFPPNTLTEFIRYAKQNGEQVRLADAGRGGISQFCGALLEQGLGVNLTSVPYQGTGPALKALLLGQVDIVCDQTTQTMGPIKAGSVKLYGVTTSARIAMWPDTPTLTEGGLKELVITAWHGIYGPKDIPPNVLNRLNAALREALQDPDLVDHIQASGGMVEPVDQQTPEALEMWLKKEMSTVAKILHNLN